LRPPERPNFGPQPGAENPSAPSTASDEHDQHARGYASYFFTERALALLEDRPGA
jgi:hypothetical protein